MALMHGKDFEQQIRSDPENDENFLVYGDWLQEQGHPRGDLVALQYARRNKPDSRRLRGEESALIGKHQLKLLGSLAQHLDCLHLEWRLGFVRAVRIFGGSSLGKKRSVTDIVLDLSTHSSFHFLESLTVGMLKWPAETGCEPDDLLAQLSECLPNLREVFLFDDTKTIEANAVGFFQEMSDLRSVSLAGNFEIDRPLRLSALKRLQLHSRNRVGFSKTLETLAVSDLAALTDLAVTCKGLEASVLCNLIQQSAPLKRLCLWQLNRPMATLEVLLDSPSAASLEHLDLTGGTLDDANAAMIQLARATGRLPNLETLILDGNRIGLRTIESLGATIDTVRAIKQREQAVNRSLPFFSDDQPSVLLCKVEAIIEGTEVDAELSLLRNAPLGGRQLYNKSAQMMMDGNTIDSLPLVRASLEMPDPMFIQRAWENAAIAHAHEKDFDLAIDLVKQSILLYSKNANRCAILIDALRHSRRMNEALAELERSKTLISASSEGVALLQDCMLTHLVARQPNAAIELYQDFVEVEGAFPRPQTLACAVIAYCHAGFAKKARKLFWESVNKATDDPVAEHARACIASFDNDDNLIAECKERAAAANYPEMRFWEQEDPFLCER